MKKINLLFVALLSTIIVFTSCKQKFDEPVITVPAEITIELADLSKTVLEGNIIADENDVLELVTFTETFANIGYRTLKVTDFTSNTYYFSFTGEYLEAKEGFVNIVVDVTTVNEKTATKEIKVNIIPKPDIPDPDPTYLSEDEFTWERIGINPATGIEKFGLEWVDGMNEDQMCYIKPLSGTKLIEIIEEEIPGLDVFDAIKTLEALQQRVDAITTGLDVFNKISSANEQEYDYLLATQVGEDYYLIHITNNKIENGLTGNKVTITGNYKYVE
ncbi:hypothetical protein LJC25_04540 [Bacteroidales bacterium OttesenSCG-928-K03]|nr:hypothetical protein [Odoribacter sp. OttesenSCG-928-L07]MDL2240153.1 hypothetical protein [Bacteroidales bacterium OttesenSCG-928-K22]MDL2242977.1 hypothetical protein [Bacteroidales bacterium OttesenSCG-928-K03]